ncbi:MAG: sensor histidine kinase, partial [Bacteroidota bacterium]
LRKESEERSRLQQERIEALEQTDKLKDEFLSVISHELRTPLNSIMGFSSLLQDEVMGALTPPQREYVDKILASADRMLELINNLLDIARMRAGRFELFPVEADYALLVNEVVAAFAPQAREKRLTVESDIEVPGPVLIDEQRIAQVLNNLLSNAIKFTPEDGKIVIKAYLAGKNLVTEITDTGIGISKEDLPRLFSPFQQLDMSLTRKVGGSGLGLSISKGIVEAHGGRLMAESPGPGQGSTFRFVLPLEQG